MRMIQNFTGICALVLTVATVSGCSSLSGKKHAESTDGRFKLAKRFSAIRDKEVAYETPQSMVAIWKASTYERAGAKSMRGFGGRFYFYDADNEPVRVKGDLVVYGYDDDTQKNSQSGGGKADKKFVFKADSLNTHYSESALGESYSFWVPWDVVGGVEKTITLIPVFKTVDGHVPEAKPATLRLPGKRRAQTQVVADALPPKGSAKVVQASAELGELPPGTIVTSPKPKPRRARRTPTTLRLTPRLAEHLSKPGQRRGNKRNAHVSRDLDKTRTVEGESAETVEKAKVESTAKDKSTFRQPNPPRTTVFGQPGAFQ